MAPKTDAEQRRMKISPTLIKYVRDRAPREVHNDDIAEALGLTRAQVRNSLRNVVNVHPEQGIVEPSPYVYTYVKPDVKVTAPDGSVMSATGGWIAPTVAEVTGIPAVSVRRGGVQFGSDPKVVCDFTVVKRTKDVIILQDTDDDSLWVARKL